MKICLYVDVDKFFKMIVIKKESTTKRNVSLNIQTNQSKDKK